MENTLGHAHCMNCLADWDLADHINECLGRTEHRDHCRMLFEFAFCGYPDNIVDDASGQDHTGFHFFPNSTLLGVFLREELCGGRCELMGINLSCARNAKVNTMIFLGHHQVFHKTCVLIMASVITYIMCGT
jgi:hypothetical protein